MTVVRTTLGVVLLTVTACFTPWLFSTSWKGVGVEDDEIYVQHDGKLKTWIKRQVVADGPVTTGMYRYNMKENNIRIVNGSVHLPAMKLMQADYFRKELHVGHGGNDTEIDIGVARHLWGSNPMSALSPEIRLGIAEKMHSLKNTGNPVYHDFDNNKEKLRSQWDKQYHDQSWIAGTEITRFQTVLYYSNAAVLFTPQLLAAMLDPNQIVANRNYVKENNFKPSDVDHAVRADLWKEFKTHLPELDKLKDDKTLLENPIFSDANCHHFENTSGNLFANAEEIVIPLDTKFVVYRGQTGFTPLGRIGFLNGFQFFSVSDDGKYLELYIMISSAAHLELYNKVTGTEINATWNPVNHLSIGRPDGYKLPVPPSGRKQGPAPGLAAATMFALGRALPVDFGALWENPNITCPQSTHDKYAPQIKGMDFTTSCREIQEGKLPTLNWVTSNDMRVLALSYACGGSYAKPTNTYKYSHGFDLLHALVQMHLLMESTDGNRQPSLDQDWNTILDID